MSTDIQNFLSFVLCGFTTVWTFRHLKKIQRTSDFEYLALSIFWGVVVLMLFDLLPGINTDQKNKLLTNPFAAGLVLSIFGFSLGFFGYQIRRIKIPKKIIDFFLLK